MARFVNIGKVDELFAEYEPLVLSIASRIRHALPNLPGHILDEFQHEARFSLIKSLNAYNKKYRQRKRKAVSIKTEITWQCYTHISLWWIRTYCGCRHRDTQVLNSLWPAISKEVLGDSMPTEYDMTDSPVDIVMDREARDVSRQLFKRIQRALHLTRKHEDVLVLPYGEYNTKWPGEHTKKSHDNSRQALRRRVREWLGVHDQVGE